MTKIREVWFSIPTTRAQAFFVNSEVAAIYVVEAIQYLPIILENTYKDIILNKKKLKKEKAGR